MQVFTKIEKQLDLHVQVNKTLSSYLKPEALTYTLSQTSYLGLMRSAVTFR